jgi:hypothetical protein
VSLLKTNVNEFRNQLLDDSQRVAQQAMQATRWRAVLRFLTATVLVVCFLMICDSWLQREEGLWRWLATGLAILSVSLLAYRWLLPAFQFQTSPLEIARWLEKRRPDSAGPLSVALELATLTSDDRRFGSSDFRDAAMVQWIKQATQPDWSGLVQWSLVRRAFIGLASVGALVLALFGIWPERSWQAARRLALPWSVDPWPRRDQLSFLNLPSVVGHGASLQLEVMDAAPPLPEDVTVQLRQLDDRSQIVDYPCQLVETVAVANISPLRADVEVRAIGGDDHAMPWQTIRVIAVPQWKSHRFEVHLPEYLRSSTAANPAFNLAADSGSGKHVFTGQRISVPAGSQVLFLGQLDRRVQAVQVQSDSAAVTPDSPTDPKTQSAWTATLDSLGTDVRLEDAVGKPLRVQENMQWSFSFQMEGKHLVDSLVPWSIEVIPDQPPEVSQEVPQIPSIASGASLPVTGNARDDWGLRDVKVKLSLESMPELILERQLPITGAECDLRLKEEWDFSAELAKLGHVIQPQEQLLLWIEATDHLGQMGKSQIERWSIESPNDQLERIAELQVGLAQEFQDLLQLQLSSQQLAEKTQEQLQMEPLQQYHWDAANSIVQLQQSISQQFDGANDGVLQRVERMLNLLEMNRLSSTELYSQIHEIQQRISSETSRQADTAWERSVEFQTDLQSTLEAQSNPDALQSNARRLIEAQIESLRALQALAEQLDNHQTLGRHRRELMELSDQQKMLLSEIRQSQVEALQTETAVTEQEFSDFSEQQSEIARRLERWMNAVPATENEQETMSRLGEQLNNASRILARAQTPDQIRQAVQALQANQLGQAIAGLQSVEETFDEAVGKLAEGDTSRQQDAQQAPMEIQAQQLWLLRQLLPEWIASQSQLVADFENAPEGVDRLGAPINQEPNIQSLIARQEAIRALVLASRDQSDQLPIFQWALQQITNDMAKAVANARRRRLNPDASLHANDALNRLTALEASLSESDQEETAPLASDGTDPQDSSSRDSTPNPSESDNPNPAPLASLKLLRSLQLELLRQTQAVAQISDNSRRNLRRSELSEQQQELADKLNQMLEVLESPPEFDKKSGQSFPQELKP